MKQCSKCKVHKYLTEFYKSNQTKDGLRCQCKSCILSQSKNWVLTNKIRKSQTGKKHHILNKDKINQNKKLYYIKNKQNIDARNLNNYYKNIDSRKLYTKLNKHKIYKQRNQRMKENPIFRLSCYLRNRLNSVLSKMNATKIKKLKEYLGCTVPELRNHLEAQFKPGMTWENHGLHGWHIDHRIPLASAKTEEELYKLCHYTNLQPLWAKENLRKSDKVHV